MLELFLSTAIDPELADDYGEMIELGLIDDIGDERLLDYFRLVVLKPSLQTSAR